ncbi:MAG TPA: autotransporter-associated beta strand repeat-containing protein [Burkholderiaceae bacterium]
MSSILARRPFVLTLIAAVCLSACGGGDDDNTTATTSTTTSDAGQSAALSAPQGLGYSDSAPVADETAVLPYVDYAYTNQRGDARYATLQTNAGVRVVAGFLDIWKPGTLLVDAGVTAAANGSFPAVTASTWTGIPGDATDGTVLNAAVHNANIQYVVDKTAQRTSAQELAAYLDDRRGKGYSVTDGLGPLTTAWRSAAQQTTSITAIAADATTVLYSDTGNNTGVGSASGNTSFGSVVDFVNNIGQNASTEPAKRFYKYARPWRWSSSVKVVPALVPAESATPGTDGGYISGHAAEAMRDALAMAYVLPERYQEILSRALELGENRIYAGMHSPLDVIGGRIQAQAAAAASIATGANAAGKAAAYAQAHTALMAAAGTSDLAAFNAYAHSQGSSADRFADHATNQAEYLRRLTHGFGAIADTGKPAVVPKSAEVLLETRLPYLDASQRRVVLKTTALPSGYPAMDDAEGWGRLNLFAAADGYGAFNGDVTVTMDASLGGFSAADSWRNDISGAGKLTKAGSGTLTLTGSNSYSGGTEIAAGTLQAASTRALGSGAVYLGGGTLVSQAASALTIAGTYTQLAGTTLELVLGGGGAGRLSVGGTATIAGGTLSVKFANGYAPAVGDTLSVLGAGALRGTFTTITVPGFKVTPTYTATGLQLHIDG